MPAAIQRFGTTPPQHVVGNWYVPFTNGILTSGGALGANSIRVSPFRVTETITISELAARVSTLSAGGLVQLAVYASRPASPLPGKLIGATGSLSTTSAATISGDIVGADTKLLPGIYWAAINQDNAVAAYAQLANTATNMARIVGSATVTEVLETGGSTSRPALAVSQTFGTWPDLTNSTLSVTTNHAVIAYKVSAVS